MGFITYAVAMDLSAQNLRMTMFLGPFWHEQTSIRTGAQERV